MDIFDRFEVFDNDFLKFGDVKNKRSQRPDLHALILLDELFPNPGNDIIVSAEHDEIWVDVEGSKLNALSDGQIHDLVRCGIKYDNEDDCLSLYV